MERIQSAIFWCGFGLLLLGAAGCLFGMAFAVPFSVGGPIILGISAFGAVLVVVAIISALVVR